ncbi:hypothetical protein RFI_02893 [Reticulomyxa filosa]|uniref:Uncharacterized protein n=1 Tax=Reticulomyxa filosa TaxID=46433 RepID=X6P7N1_RETFI|nr:hypothetical protein RFI_02893 [Reticulomyxa filosa]|eukprot:ETO34201.1 hypothetical protein RFI_02893 [Reticulomyxa filosa]
MAIFMLFQTIKKNKDKENGNENKNKKEEANVTSNESSKEQEPSAVTTKNEKSQPRQISENKRGHFPKENFFFILLHLQTQTDMHLWMTRISSKKKKNYYFVT